MPSAIIYISKSETVPTLGCSNSVIFSFISRRWVFFKNLFELATSICNQNFAIFCRLGSTLISVEDIIFDGDEKLDLKLVVVCEPHPPIKQCSCRTVFCSHLAHLSLGWAYRTPTAIEDPTTAPKRPEIPLRLLRFALPASQC